MNEAGDTIWKDLTPEFPKMVGPLSNLRSFDLLWPVRNQWCRDSTFVNIVFEFSKWGIGHIRPGFIIGLES